MVVELDFLLVLDDLVVELAPPAIFYNWDCDNSFLLIIFRVLIFYGCEWGSRTFLSVARHSLGINGGCCCCSS
jgi:hypothetical protein